MLEEESSVEVLSLSDDLWAYLWGIFLDPNYCKRTQQILGSTMSKAGGPDLYKKAWSQAKRQHSSIGFCFTFLLSRSSCLGFPQ